MDFLDIYQLKIVYFTIISFLIIFSVNKIFVKFLVKIKIFDIHEKIIIILYILDLVFLSQ